MGTVLIITVILVAVLIIFEILKRVVPGHPYAWWREIDWRIFCLVIILLVGGIIFLIGYPFYLLMKGIAELATATTNSSVPTDETTTFTTTSYRQIMRWMWWV